VPVRILADNSDGILRSHSPDQFELAWSTTPARYHSRCLPEKIILDRVLNSRHLFDGFLRVLNPMNEQIDVGGGGKSIMIILAEQPHTQALT